MTFVDLKTLMYVHLLKGVLTIHLQGTEGMPVRGPTSASSDLMITYHLEGKKSSWFCSASFLGLPGLDRQTVVMCQ